MSDNRGIKFSELDILVDVPGNYHVHIFSGEDKTNYKVRVTRLIDNISEEIGEREGLATREWVKAQVEAAEGYYELKDEEGNIISSGKVTINETVEVIAPNANYIVKDNDGFLITSGAIASGGTEDIIIDNTIVTIYDSNNDILYSEVVPVGEDYDVNIKDSQAIIKDSSGNVLKSENILAEGSKDITIQDSEVVIKDSSDNTLKSENILAEGSKDISINDSTAIIKNSEGNTLKSENILAEGSKDITIQDSEVEIKNSAGTTLYSENIPAEQGEELIIQDSTAIIKDTDNNILYTESILAEGSKDITVQDSTFTVKNSEDNVLKQDSILAQGSGEYTVQDSEVIIKDKFGNVIEQDSITAEGSKELTVNTQLPIKNTEGNEVGTEINEEIIVGDSNITVKDSEDNILINFDVPAENNEERTINDSTAFIKDSKGYILKYRNILAEGSMDIIINDSQAIIKDSSGNTLKSESILAERSKDITIQDSQVTLKNTKDEILSSENILAEGSKEITAPNSNFKITDFSGNTFIEGEIASGASEEFEIWAKDYRPLIFKYDTTLSGDNEIILRGTGNYEKHITIKDMQGNILEEYWTTDNNVINTNHPVGEYYVEIRQRAGDYYTSNNVTITNQRATLTEIVQFGDVIWDTGDLRYLYRDCGELIITAKDVMKFRDGVITGLISAFETIKGVAETTWLEQFPWGKVQGDANNFFANTPNFAKDTLELDFKDADILSISSFFFDYQIGGSNGIQTLIIKNMESCVNMTGRIIHSVRSAGWSGGFEKVIFQGLQVSQNMTAWRPTDPINIMLFFLNLGDRTGETQSTITIRTQEWDLLTQEQKDVVEDILVNKNWALSLI